MSRAQRRWTLQEDALLREHVQRQSPGMSSGYSKHCDWMLSTFLYLGVDGRSINWEKTAKVIPGRSNKDCRKRFFNEVTGGLKKVNKNVSPQYRVPSI